MKALQFMNYPESLDGLLWHRSRRRHLGQSVAVRPPESQSPVRRARDLIALLVHRPVVPATEEREVRERCRTAVCPVAEMMSLGEAAAAPREAAAAVPVVERAP